MTYYAITKGEYSDYHICAITADKDKAERLQKIYTDHYEDAEIEEYEENDEKYLESRMIWFYDAYKDEAKKTGDFGDGEDESIWDSTYSGICGAYVVASDAEHARKKGQDMIAKRKAELAGI